MGLPFKRHGLGYRVPHWLPEQAPRTSWRESGGRPLTRNVPAW